MRYRFILSLFLFLPSFFAAYGQDSTAHADSSGYFPWSLEGRIGGVWPYIPFTLEAQAYLSPRYSIDLGVRPFPRSLYAGTSWYPGRHTVLQLQSGYMKLSQPGGNDAPIFESEFYAGVRFAVRIGDLSDMWYSMGGGTYALLDINYCPNCGGLPDPGIFVPNHINKLSWTPFIEIGFGGWLR